MRNIMKKNFLELVVLVLIQFLFGSIVIADDKTNVQKSFFYSNAFAKRFNLDEAKSVSKWNDVIAISVDKHQQDNALMCEMNLYLGKSVTFDYPGKENYFNIVDKRFDDIFFFNDSLKESDQSKLMKNSSNGVNKLMIKAYDVNGKAVAVSSLTVDMIIRDIVPEVNIIKTLPFFCDFLASHYHSVELLFLDAAIEREIMRSKTINRFKMPL